MSEYSWKPTKDDVVACLVTGAMGAWLWWLNGQLGIAAPFVGAVVGISAGYMCRHFC